MTEYITGLTPETVIKSTTPASLIEARNTLPKEEVRKDKSKLNSIDQSILSMPIEVFETFVENMSAKGISGLTLDANL
jgi:hypothetical protein